MYGQHTTLLSAKYSIAKMLKMGIGGNFLTTIQAFLTSMTVDLEVGGCMIGTVDLELSL